MDFLGAILILEPLQEKYTEDIQIKLELFRSYIGIDNYPNAEKIWKGTVSLPIYPELSEEGLEYICQTIRTLLDNKLSYSILAEQTSMIQVHDNQLLNNVSKLLNN